LKLKLREIRDSGKDGSYFDRLFPSRSKSEFPCAISVRIHNDTVILKLDEQDSLELLQRPFEPNEVNLVQKVLKKGDRVFDIGANIGYYTTLFSSLVGPAGEITAFEPDPANRSLLQENLTANRCANTSICELGVSDKTSSVLLHLCDNNQGMHRIYDSICCGVETIEIDCVALDDFVSTEQSIDFIKMDIEGAEYKALAGMSRILNQDDLMLLIEFSPFALVEAGAQTAAFIERLIDSNFDIYQIGNTLTRVNEHEVLERAKKFDQHTDQIIRRSKCATLSEFGGHLETEFAKIGYPFEILQNWLCIKGRFKTRLTPDLIG